MDTSPQDQKLLSNSAKDALHTIKTLLPNPTGEFSLAFEALGAKRALWVGIIYGGVFAFCLICATYFLLSEWARPQGFSGFITILIISAVPFISFLGAATVIRKILRAEGTLGHDSFVAGTALLPFSCAVLLGALLGLGNIEVTAIFALFATCLTILMLFTGLTRIFKTSERAATLAVPLMILASAWISKVIYTVLLN